MTCLHTCIVPLQPHDHCCDGCLTKALMCLCCPGPQHAGMVTVPRAYFMLGTAFGSMMLLIVTLLVLYTVAVLVDGNERYPGTTTYRALSRAACGRWVATLTQASIILFCFGFCVVDLVRHREQGAKRGDA